MIKKSLCLTVLLLALSLLIFMQSGTVLACNEWGGSGEGSYPGYSDYVLVETVINGTTLHDADNSVDYISEAELQVEQYLKGEGSIYVTIEGFG